eukprot:354459-Chlamydomonas_euryale.AAC.1
MLKSGGGALPKSTAPSTLPPTGVTHHPSKLPHARPRLATNSPRAPPTSPQNLHARRPTILKIPTRATCLPSKSPRAPPNNPQNAR